MTDTRDCPVKATRTSIRVLEELIELNGATLTDLVERMDLSKSSIHDHLTTLDRLGLVVREEWTYRVSLRFFRIGTTVRNEFELYRAGRAAVSRLANASGLEASLFVFEGGQLVCLSTTTPEPPQEPIVGDGDVLPLHCTAPGKAVLASFDAERVEEVVSERLEPYTESTVTTVETLREEFAVISSQGWAVDREEWQDGVRGVATVVTASDGAVLGAIGVTGATGSLSGKRFQQDVPGLVISTANGIERDLQTS